MVSGIREGLVRSREPSRWLDAGPVGAATWPRAVFCGLQAFRGGTWLVGGAPLSGWKPDPNGDGESARARGTRLAAVYAQGVAARQRSVDFATHRRRLASELPHGLVLAPGAQGGLCGGALTGERL